jgi:hypothetical protein
VADSTGTEQYARREPEQACSGPSKYRRAGTTVVSLGVV